MNVRSRRYGAIPSGSLESSRWPAFPAGPSPRWAPLAIPHRLRHRVGLAGARALHAAGPVVTRAAGHASGVLILAAVVLIVTTHAGLALIVLSAALVLAGVATWLLESSRTGAETAHSTRSPSA